MMFTWDHVLYRLYDREGALLYVGITKSIRARFKAHENSQPWWPEVAGCRVEFHPDRAALARAELDAIRYEQPRHNIRGSVSRAQSAADRPGRQRAAVPEQRQPLLDVPEKFFRTAC